jgi:hypothetical protein
MEDLEVMLGSYGRWHCQSVWTDAIVLASGVVGELLRGARI